MGRLFSGKPLAVLLVAVGSIGLWACGAAQKEAPETAVPSGNDPTFIWADPAGEFEGQEPKGVVMVIHGGGWRGTDRVQLDRATRLAVPSQNLGFATMAVDYRAGATGLADLERFYGVARRRAGPGTPVCALGESAGGHLALLLAQREPSLDCVIANVAPTDLTALAHSSASEADTAATVAAEAFGKDRLERFSPALHPDSTDAEVFLLYSENDTLVAPEQGVAMRRALPQAKLVVLGPGDAPFGHIFAPQAAQGLGVDPEQLKQAGVAELEFLEDVADRTSG
jgi:acetyl esterase/lipase